MRSRAVAIYTLLALAWISPAPHADVYFLADGKAIAGKTITRSKSPTIRVETLKGVVSFPKTEVKEKETTRELRKIYKEKERELDQGKAVEIAKLAAWCRDKGLYEEMFHLYDDLFVLDPDNFTLKSFINEMSGSIRFKELDVKGEKSVKEGYLLLKKMSRTGQAYRAIGERLLAGMPDPLREKVLLKGIKTSNAKTQDYTLKLASHFIVPGLLEEMVKIAICEKNDEVRNTAQQTLLHYKRDAILHPFIKALKSKVKDYRLNSMDALALFKDPRTAPALIENLKPASAGPVVSARGAQSSLYVGKSLSMVKGVRSQISARSAISSPETRSMKEGLRLDVNLLPVSKPVIKNDELEKIAKVLARITGVDYGEDYLLWSQWWNNNRESILSPKKP